MSETSDNAFLGGRLNLLQPKAGYRAGADPVFLAAAVAAKPGQSVLDLGCGIGTAMLCLAARVPDLRLTGVEVQAELAALARENLTRNAVAGTIMEADIGALPADLRAERFDHVLTNPPFFDRSAGSASADVGREHGRGETMTLSDWLRIALKRLLPGGQFTMVNRMERLPVCLEALGSQVGGVAVLPLAARRARPAKLFVLKAVKGSRAPFSVLPPLVLHEGDRHEADGDSYTQEARAILRSGAALPLIG